MAEQTQQTFGPPQVPLTYRPPQVPQTLAEATRAYVRTQNTYRQVTARLNAAIANKRPAATVQGLRKVAQEAQTAAQAAAQILAAVRAAPPNPLPLPPAPKAPPTVTRAACAAYAKTLMVFDEYRDAGLVSDVVAWRSGEISMGKVEPHEPARHKRGS